MYGAVYKNAVFLNQRDHDFEPDGEQGETPAPQKSYDIVKIPCSW
jgi:hypothetical protein